MIDFPAYVREWGDVRGADLSAFLSLLRATFHVDQSAHWQTRGPSYYGDHLLYQRLYEDVAKEIDSVGERAIGINGEAQAVDPELSANQVSRMVATLRVSVGNARGAHGLALLALSAEMNVLSAIDRMLSVRQTQGVQNLLQGIADTHETHVYLLRQRLGGRRKSRYSSY